MGTPAAASDRSSSPSKEQLLHDHLDSKFKSQASVLLNLLLTFDSLATLNEKKGTDGSSPSAEESSLLHSVGRFLNLQVDIWHSQVELFEEIKSFRAATAQHISQSKELSSIFNLVNTYGGISSEAMYTASTIAAGTYPLESLTTLLPNRTPWADEMEALCQRMREDKDPNQTTTTYMMNRWKDCQESDAKVVISSHALWREGHTTMPSSSQSPNSGEIDGDDDAGAPSTSSPSSSSGSVFKQGYTLGPLEGHRARCEINKESVEVVFSRESSHSYVSRSAVKRLNIAVSEGGGVRVKVANGKPLKAREYVRKCPLVIKNQVFKVDLIVLPFRECDVVLGNDWVASCEHFLEESHGVVFIRDGVLVGLRDASS